MQLNFAIIKCGSISSLYKSNVFSTDKFENLRMHLLSHLFLISKSLNNYVCFIIILLMLIYILIHLSFNFFDLAS